jgi:DNA-binding NarL/FixJ family response regulator
VLVADPEMTARAGLVVVIGTAPAPDVVGEAASGQEAVNPTRWLIAVTVDGRLFTRDVHDVLGRTPAAINCKGEPVRRLPTAVAARPPGPGSPV